jgi:predicted CoA-substrate-specific enzyme activase
MEAYVGLDVGAVSTNLAVIDSDANLLHHSYLRTHGDPIGSITAILQEAGQRLGSPEVAGSGATGSGRHLAAALAGADLVRNEISSHAAAALHYFPEARTVIEIGGQDAKIVILRDGAAVDFAMNNVCAAGTGSFLDYQAARMGLGIDQLAGMAASAATSVRISGRCGIFAETDVIEKQQHGAPRDAVLRGLCEALVRNYLAGVAKGKPIVAPVVFQGGVASNRAVVEAFERELGVEVQVPQHHDVMGAIGVALLTARSGARRPSRFRGFEVEGGDLASSSFECTGCSNRCDVIEIVGQGRLVARWGGRCGRWELSG